MEEAHAERMLDGFETGGLRVPRETRDLKINERKVGKEKGGNNDEDMGAKSRKMERQYMKYILKKEAWTIMYYIHVRSTVGTLPQRPFLGRINRRFTVELPLQF